VISEHAIVDKAARLAPDVEVGPFSIIGPDVEIASGTRIGSHTIIEGHTKIGSNNNISHHIVIGAPPQDLKYRNEVTRVEIGNGNIIREFVTIHRGTAGGHGITTIGSNSMLMAYVHIAHDCFIGNEVILANAVNLAGHVTINDYAIIGGLCALHQFIRIGRYAFIGGGTAVSQDVVPFAMVAGTRGQLEGVNAIGLKRRGFDAKRRQAIHKTIRYLIQSNLSISSALEKARAEFANQTDVQEILEFISHSERGICVR
jgi:UDP-N-acetylglucosamine acyltransferase